MQTSISRLLIAVLLGNGIITSVHAENWHLGIGGIAAPNPYIGGGGTQSAVLPFAFYEGDRLMVEPNRIHYSWFKHHGFTISAMAMLRFQGYDPADNAALAGMQKRRSSLDGGVALAYTNDLGTFSLTGLTDISDTHQGDELIASWGIPFTVGRNWLLNPTVGISWKSERLIDYYYGVRVSEVRPGRPAYSGRASTDAFVGLDIFYRLTGKWTAIAQFNYASLSNHIANSPIVVDDNQWYGFLGLAYEL